MTKEDAPPSAVIGHWKSRVEEFKVKLKEDPYNKIFAFRLACYEGYLARFSTDTKKMATETIQRAGSTARVVAGQDYHHVGRTLCQLDDTGNGYIAKFPSHRTTHQDYYVCLDYAQAYDLILALSAFKKELGFAE